MRCDNFCKNNDGCNMETQNNYSIFNFNIKITSINELYLIVVLSYFILIMNGFWCYYYYSNHYNHTNLNNNDTNILNDIEGQHNDIEYSNKNENKLYTLLGFEE